MCQVKNSGIPARYVLIKSPSIAELEKRLRARGTETEETISMRLARAREDAMQAQLVDWDCVVVNSDLEKAVGDFEGFVRGVTAGA